VFLMSDEPRRADGSGGTQYAKQRLDSPGAGWQWRDLGPKGPGWYPPIVEGVVDTSREHMALCPLDDGRTPGDALALVGAHADDTLFVQILTASEATTEGVERLFFTSFQDPGFPPLFELAYEFSQRAPNKMYSNPMWIYIEG